MALGVTPKNAVQGVLTLADGTGTPVTMTVSVSLGDTAISELKKVLNETVVVERRGKFVYLLHGARIYPTISFTAHFTETTNATAGGLADFLLQKGAHSANVSTQGSSALKYTLKATLTIEGTNLGDDADSVIVMNHVEFTVAFQESMDVNTLPVNGVIYGAITGLDAAQVA